MSFETMKSSRIGQQFPQNAWIWVGMLLCLFISGCAGGISQTLQQSLSIVAPTKIDFSELHYFALRSSSAYDGAGEIQNTYPLLTRVNTVQPIDVKYFIETNSRDKTQTLSVRGTAEKENVWEDIETALIQDSILGIFLHKGFQKDAKAILQDARPYLRKDYSLRITGHSLGGAVAEIIALYLDDDGYRITRVVTFGGPRFTTENLRTASLDNTVRVVHDRDVVPLLPPHSAFGQYKHSSAEIILRPGKDYVYLNDHDAGRLSVGEFWRSITVFSFRDHHMQGYLRNIQLKIEKGAVQVPYIFAQEILKVPDG